MSYILLYLAAFTVSLGWFSVLSFARVFYMSGQSTNYSSFVSRVYAVACSLSWEFIDCLLILLIYTSLFFKQYFLDYSGITGLTHKGPFPFIRKNPAFSKPREGSLNMKSRENPGLYHNLNIPGSIPETLDSAQGLTINTRL